MFVVRISIFKLNSQTLHPVYIARARYACARSICMRAGATGSWRGERAWWRHWWAPLLAFEVGLTPQPWFLLRSLRISTITSPEKRRSEMTFGGTCARRHEADARAWNYSLAVESDWSPSMELLAASSPEAAALWRTGLRPSPTLTPSHTRWIRFPHLESACEASYYHVSVQTTKLVAESVPLTLAVCQQLTVNSVKCSGSRKKLWYCFKKQLFGLLELYEPGLCRALQSFNQMLTDKKTIRYLNLVIIW